MSDINLNQQEENLQKSNSEKQEIMILAIELGDNEKKFLKIYNDSKPEQLAYEFCLQNNLDFNSLQELTEQIRNAFNTNNKYSNQNIMLNQNNNFNSNIQESNSNDLISNNNNTKKNNNNIKENTIEALSQLLNSKNNSKQNFYPPKQRIIKSKINNNQNNSNYKKIPNSKKNIKHYLSHTASSQSKKRPSKSDFSVYTNENVINKSNNSNNILKNLNQNNSNNNIEKEYDLNNSESNYNLSKNNIKNNRPLISENPNDYMLNYGERLYHKGLKLQEKTNTKIEKIKNDNENKHKKNCTFKPKINNISYNALTKRYNNKLSRICK